MAAPAVLAIACVVLPYLIGLAAADVAPDAFDARVIGCFLALFAGRILLKDFRDRRGHAAFGKRTFLLTQGKDATIAAVYACVVAGSVVLLTVLPPNAVLVVAVETYFLAIGLQLHRLWRAGDVDDERLAIALGALMGNALVLTWLGFVMLGGAGAGSVEQGAFTVVLASMFWFAYVYMSTRPQAELAACRG